MAHYYLFVLVEMFTDADCRGFEYTQRDVKDKQHIRRFLINVGKLIRGLGQSAQVFCNKKYLMISLIVFSFCKNQLKRSKIIREKSQSGFLFSMICTAPVTMQSC